MVVLAATSPISVLVARILLATIFVGGFEVPAKTSYLRVSPAFGSEQSHVKVTNLETLVELSAGEGLLGVFGAELPPPVGVVDESSLEQLIINAKDVTKTNKKIIFTFFILCKFILEKIFIPLKYKFNILRNQY